MRAKHNGHLVWVSQLPCTVCGNSIETEAAHIRFAEPKAAKSITGIGIKPDDEFVLPLCSYHHHEQHSMGEKRFWAQHYIDPIFVSLALWRVSGNHEAGCQIIAACRS